MLQPLETMIEAPTEAGAGHAADAPATPAIDPSWRAGHKLAAARAALGLSIEEAGARIRLRPDYVAALEAMNVKLLPGTAYALAYLRSYAKFLGFDPAELSAQFQDECALSRFDSAPQVRDPSSRPHPERPWLVAVVIFAAGAGLVLWRAVSAGYDPEAAPARTPTQQVIVAAPAQDIDAIADVRRPVIEVRALTAARLEARGPDGTVFLSRDMMAGDIYRPDASPGWKLHALDGGAFEVYVNGRSVGRLGDPGRPVLGRPVDEIAAAPAASPAS